MIPAVVNLVVELLKHDKEIVRKKAVMCMHRFYQLQPESVEHLADQFRRILCDKDPSVMGAALNILYELAQKNVQAFKDLVPSYVSILKQITEHRLPRDYDYHRMPAPWIQIKLLQLLALLGAGDQSASEGMYEVLHEVMRRADTGINVGYAIIYECVRTVTQIYPNATLLDAAASNIARFIGSDNHNLKYLGVTGLAAIVTDHPKYAADHQMVVMECLEDPDETLRRKTLDLLFRMTNPVNVEVVVGKLIGDVFCYNRATRRCVLGCHAVAVLCDESDIFAENHYTHSFSLCLTKQTHTHHTLPRLIQIPARGNGQLPSCGPRDAHNPARGAVCSQQRVVHRDNDDGL